MIPAIAAGIGPLGPSAWSVGGVGGIGAGGPGAVAPTGSGSFGSALTSAMSALDQSQTAADAASQGLATGTLTNPTQAITAVENASLEMQFAAQIRDKLTTDVNTIFQTQM